MRCPIDSTTRWRRCWQENCLSPFGLQDIYAHAKASPKQPEAASLISQCMFSLCSACVTSAAPLYLRQEKSGLFFFLNVQSAELEICSCSHVWPADLLNFENCSGRIFLFLGLCDGRFHGFCSSTHHAWRGSKMAEESDHFLRFAWNVLHFGQPQN